MSTFNKNVLPIMVAKHVYVRFHTIMREMTIDANSLMQYLFVLYAKYGKNPKDSAPEIVSSNPAKVPKRKVKTRTARNKYKKAIPVSNIQRTELTVLTDLQNESIIHNSTSPNCSGEATTFSKDTSKETNDRDAHLVVDSKTTVESGSEDTHGNVDDLNSVDVANIAPVIRRNIKLSVNSKTGSLRICEVPENYGSLLNNRLTLPPEVDIWKHTAGTDLNQSIIDISDILKSDSTQNGGTEITASRNDDIANMSGISGLVDSEKNDASGIGDISAESAKKSVVCISPPGVTGDWMDNENMLELSPSKESIALQRSRRKSKPQKFVLLDDNFTLSEDELNCDSFDLENFDVDWLGLDIEDNDATAVSPKRSEAPTGKTTASLNKGRRVYQCPHCNVRMTRSDRLERHVQSAHQSPAAFQCSACSRPFTSQFRLECHQSLLCRFANLPYSCDVCKLSYKTADARDSHRCSGDSKKPFMCNECDYKTRFGKEMEQHRVVHSDIKKYQCDMCDFKTAWKKSLSLHISKHDGKKPFCCTICDFTCNDKCNLNNHIKSHSDELNQICAMCGSRFRSKRHLKNHERLHSNEKNYKCDECDYATASLPNLISHRPVHLDRKKHTCSQCEKSFSRPALLTSHVLKIHSENRAPFSCRFCDYVGTCKQGLNSHMKKHSKRSNENVEVRTSERKSRKVMKLMDSAKEIVDETNSGKSCRDHITYDRDRFNNDPSNCGTVTKDEQMKGCLETFNYPREIVIHNSNAIRDNSVGEVKSGRDAVYADAVETIGPHVTGLGVKLNNHQVTDEREIGNHLGHTYNSSRCLKLGHTEELGQPEQLCHTDIDTIRELHMFAGGSLYDQSATEFDARDHLVHDMTDASLNAQLLMTFGSNRASSTINASRTETTAAVMNVLQDHSANSACVLDAADELFLKVTDEYSKSSTISDELLTALKFIFPSTLQSALDLVDNNAVTRLTCPKDRHIFQVIGSSGTPYTCLWTAHYCSCPAFKFSVIKKGDQVLCKHLVALRLSEAMGVTKQVSMSDQTITDMLVQLE